jgi:hypothetical protein
MTAEKREKKCIFLDINGENCGRDLYSEDSCIFHSNDIERKKGEFQEEFWKEFERQKKEEEVYDFKSFVFPADISFFGKNFEKNVHFMEAKFEGDAGFGLATFTGDANFGSAKFSGNAHFFGAEFPGVANFKFVTISGYANFETADFTGVANFESAKILGDALFYSTKFTGDAHFESAKFSGNALFESTRFKRDAHFKSATISGDARFGTAEFTGVANLKFVTISGNAHFDSTKFTTDANFESATISGDAHFESVEFPEDKSRIKMVDSYFYNVYGLLKILEATKKERRITKTNTEILSENIKIILGEKGTARYPIIGKKMKDDLFLMKYKEKHKITHFLWWIFADCGRSFFRWALWSILFAVLFAYLFFSMGTEAFSVSKLSFSFETMLYYSVVTFTTLGFGDVIPNTVEASRLVMLEVILGYIMLGGLISILANKLARRS